MEPFILSNSALQDWESMCKLAWKRRWIDGVQSESSEAMLWGQYFETLVIGSGAQGRIFQWDPRNLLHIKMQKSDYRARVEAQAKTCREYLKILGGKIVRVQHRLTATFTDSTGYTFQVDGGLDIEYRLPNGTVTTIDLKLTGDAENDYGKFAWGTPEKMDLSQIVHYGFLIEKEYGYYPEVQYYMVFDKSPAMMRIIIPVSVSEQTKYDHIERFAQAHKEISMCLEFNDFPASQAFSDCFTCNSKCEFERILPDMDTIII